MFLARSLSKHDVVVICRDLNAKFGERYSFCPMRKGIKCTKWPQKRELDEETPKHAWYGVPYVKQIWIEAVDWPSVVPSDWDKSWWDQKQEIVYRHTENQKVKIRWDCTPWDGASWTFNQKVMICSSLYNLGILQKRRDPA